MIIIFSHVNCDKTINDGITKAAININFQQIFTVSLVKAHSLDEDNIVFVV